MSTLPQVAATPTSQTVRRPSLPALTGIRAFVSMDIVFFHFSNPRWFGPLAPLVDGGFVGVSFFFVLSGFILFYNYGDTERLLGPLQFWKTRLARLYPVYVLALVVSYRVLIEEWQAQTHLHFAEGMVLTPLMLQGWVPAVSTFWNTPGWTLSSEIAFYAMLPWLVAVRWPSEVRRLLGMLALFWLAGMLLPGLYEWLRPDGIAHVDRYSYGFWLRAVKFMPLPHVPEFLFGVTLARLNRVLPLRSAERLAITVTGLAGTLGVMKLAGSLPFVLLHDGLLMPVFGMIILGLAGKHLIADFFALSPFAAVGEASYCLYLIHFNLWELIHHFHLWDALHVAWLDPWISYASVVGAALASYRWLERPARKWMLARLGS